VNHLSHFLLTLLLLDILQKSKPSRIVTLSSNAHMMGETLKMKDLPDYEDGKRYDAWGAYGKSKLCNILFTYELQRRLGKSSGVTALVVHPGVIRSSLWQYNKYYSCCICKCPTDGAKTSIYAATSSRYAEKPSPQSMEKKDTDRYLVPRCCCVGKPRTLSSSYSISLQKDLWNHSLEWTGLDANTIQLPNNDEDITVQDYFPTQCEQFLTWINMVPCFYCCC